MNQLYADVEKELTEHILPFWMKLKDDVHGGMYGTIDFDLDIQQQADKGGVVTTRFLWTFSSAYRVTKNKAYLLYANHLYDFLVHKLYDNQHQGLFWLVNYQGNPKDMHKHIYAQSFGIYALSEYYRASNEQAALDLAIKLFRLIESKGYSAEREAYMEEFDREWNPVPNEKLSGNGVVADITMNTHIHILEAYTNLYKVWPNPQLKERLEHLMRLHYEHIYNKKSKYLDVFFNGMWESLIDIQSFGHDIEASWLMDETIKVLHINNENYTKMVLDIAYNISEYAIQEDGSLINEEVNGLLDHTRIWWVQAEAIVGFYNAYERTGDEHFLTVVKKLWSYTEKNIIDKRPNGEWFWAVDEKGKPAESNIGDPWKASYHNGRCCLELMERIAKGYSGK